MQITQDAHASLVVVRVTWNRLKRARRIKQVPDISQLQGNAFSAMFSIEHFQVPTFPVGHGFVPQLDLVLSRSTIMVHEVVSEHFPGDTVGTHHLHCRCFQ